MKHLFLRTFFCLVLAASIPTTLDAATYTVTTTVDSGPGSLRQAITDANINSGADTILFNIAPAGVKTITVLTALPALNDPVTIDGTSQPGYAGTPVIELNGGLGAFDGLRINSGHSFVRGLAIYNFAGVGIRIVDGGNNNIIGNYIGTDSGGVTDRGNTAGGILIDTSPNNIIGGALGVGGNVISGNNWNGVEIQNAGAVNNLVIGNLIGTTASGNAALPNLGAGILVQLGAANNVIGGTSGTGNVISGNNLHGIEIAAANSNRVEGNFIGTGINGTTVISNNLLGIHVISSFNTIGGTNAGARNIISGNGQGGIKIEATRRGNVIAGNFIGTDVNGKSQLGNGLNGHGIYLADAPTNTIGGAVAGARNIISGNMTGIFIVGTNATGNQIQGNFIGTSITGTTNLPNYNGIYMTNVVNTLIGGTNAAARNVISGNSSIGILVEGTNSTGNLMQGNYIGPDVTGRFPLGNYTHGILILNGYSNVIGGAVSGAGNVISATIYWSGVNIGGSNQVIQGNFIGTDAAGTNALGNGPGSSIGGGLLVSGYNHQIGGTVAEARNVISGNGFHGIGFTSASNCVVEGNFIGVDATGTNILGNYNCGIFLEGGRNNTIGNSYGVAGGNVISGNNVHGIQLDQGANNNFIHANRIGTDLAGNLALGNNGDGIALTGWTNGASHTYIGGDVVSANIIAHNGGDGVRVAETSNLNPIYGNSIFENGGLGINLQPDFESPGTVTLNDTLDADTGPNTLQNFPLITNITYLDGFTTIKGTLHSLPNTPFYIDIYRSLTNDPSDHGEGQFYTGYAFVTTDPSGNATFSFDAFGYLPNQFFTATASRGTDFTSEFSRAVSARPGVIQFLNGGPGSVYSNDEPITNFVLTVIRTGGGYGTVTVDYVTSSGTAVSPADYTHTFGTLTFTNGEILKNIFIPVNNDTLDEDDEEFTLTLSNATGGATLGTNYYTAIRILDNDPLPSLSVNDVSVTEGNSGTVSAIFTVSLSAASGRTVSVNYTTSNDTATPPGDYTGVPPTELIFPPGVTTRPVIVSVNGETANELNETFFVDLFTATNAIISDSRGIGTILNDDPVPTLSINDIVVVEQTNGAVNATFTVSLSAASGRTVTVNYSTADGTAFAPGDYTAIPSTTLTIVAGFTNKTITVVVQPDLLAEPQEIFAVNLSSPTNATIADSQGVCTIVELYIIGYTWSGGSAGIYWSSVAGRVYQLQRTANLTPPILWSSVPGAENIPGNPVSTSFIDSSDSGAPRRFYRVMVR